MKGFSLQRFKAMIKKEFVQLKRDPISLRIAIMMPIMMMIIFGYAVNTDVDNIPTAVFDSSKTQESRDYIQRFTASGYFKIKYNVTSEKELSELIDTGKAKAGIVIPVDFSKTLKQNKTADTQLLIDGTDPTSARTALSSGVMVSDMYSRELTEEVKKKKGVNLQAPTVHINPKTWYNPNLVTQNFTIPGLLGVILQNITVMLTAFAFVREKERGTIEQLMVTPIKPLEMIVAKLVPFIIIGFLGFLISLGICVYWFKISIAGSVLLLMLFGMLFVISSLSLGMLISTFAENQMQAMMGAVAIILPSTLLSGFMFPREAMPQIIAGIGYLLPITYFINIVRGIVLRGVGSELMLPEIIPLITMTLLLLLVASLRVRKRLD